MEEHRAPEVVLSSCAVMLETAPESDGMPLSRHPSKVDSASPTSNCASRRALWHSGPAPDAADVREERPLSGELSQGAVYYPALVRRPDSTDGACWTERHRVCTGFQQHTGIRCRTGGLL